MEEQKNKFFSILNDSSVRIKTGVILVVVLLIIGWIDSYFLTWVLLGALLVIAISESMKLFEISDTRIYYYSGALWLGAYFYPNAEDLLFVGLIVMASVLAYSKNIEKTLFLPLIYPTASFLFMFALYAQFGMGSLLWLLVIVAGADVGAYFVGRNIGKTQFCSTSPNKTLEGVAGGVLVSTLLGVIFAIDEVSLIGAIVVSIVVSIASVFGDLFESYLKREAGVKDSGDILPGHGGILDRTDGYLFAGVVMIVLLRMFI
ncbi:MAG: phosphatidate cytidylyltransferase [Campylobacterota bacterium]|nr:phosphatidate cytidylyltransferase [Campylobacterota bacterium]